MQKTLILIVLIINFYLLFIIYKYWKADIYFNKSQIEKALEISPNEPIYISKLATLTSSIEIAKKALLLNLYNQNTRRVLVNNLVKNADVNPNNLNSAEEIIKDGIKLAPNDPKLYYQLGILQLKLNKNNEAISNLEKAVELKANYKEARFALGEGLNSLK